MKNILSAFCSVALLAGISLAGPLDPGAVKTASNVNGVDYEAVLGGFLNGAPGQQHDAARVDLAAAFDGSASTFYALGIGGTLVGEAQPGFVFETGVGVIEVTFGTVNQTYPESALMEFFDTNGTVQASVELRNLGSSANSCFGATAGLNCSTTQNSDSTLWSIVLPATFNFSKVVITDTTAVNFAGTYASNGRLSDGFDIAELTIRTTASPVPEPGTISMIGLGLGMVALAYRKRGTRR
jgi:hypothetical protein